MVAKWLDLICYCADPDQSSTPDRSIALMMSSPVVGIVFLQGLALDFTVVIDIWAHTRDVSPSIHDNRDAEHAVPKELGAARIWKAKVRNDHFDCS